MQLNLQTDYALRLIVYLRINRDQAATVNQIASAFGISANHLSKVAQQLTQEGWVVGQRGRGGGLRLKTDMGTMTIAKIVRRFEPAWAIVECLGDHSNCAIDGACRLKSILREARNAFLSVLDGYTVDDITKNPRQLSRLLAISV